ncbi:CRISPR-associated RAMP protein, Csm4 family [Thermosinus carboxydivorans Nor1]|uniref:CRISPR system Cms protein Csm4 n=1 Tax=Thermosinus carboxydivorans Nor1 TaxID=401526 RepID=A1HM61_9FIRM|nr:type III-A CRISPR-associated RAMP protein Csm4 [Thermosinus carboxydivorans]EAX48910.1 CRISPR-associated RAMP protein, Csm4 family [Thermosinus carboxydivorans Nor1]
MLFRLYKLRFLTPVRFGDDGAAAGLDQARLAGRADTLFSALCSEAAMLSAAAPQRLAAAAADGNLLVTDLFPYRGETLYLPRPLLPPDTAWQQPAAGRTASATAAHIKKKLNKLPYLPVRLLPAYLYWLRTGDSSQFDLDNANAIALSDIAKFSAVRVNARVDGERQTLPYVVTQYQFGAGCGLYFVAAAADQDLLDWIDRLIASLSYSGIGGKRSAGLGKFELAEDPIDMDETGVYADDAALYSLLTATDADWYMALSCLWPLPNEVALLADGFYSLTARGGFVASPAYAPSAVKHHSVHMLAAGSCLKAKAAGQVGDLAAGGKHPVYRYGKPLYAGLKL